MAIEDVFLTLSGALAGVGFMAVAYLISWQIRLGPDDRQKMAAVVFFVCFALLLFQLALAYLFGYPLGRGWRGLVTFGGVVLSAVGLAYETRRHNTAVLRRWDGRDRDDRDGR